VVTKSGGFPRPELNEATAFTGSAADVALADFVSEHYDRLLRLARLVCDDASDAADAVQLGFEQAWRRRATLRDVTRTRPWLDRIVVREAIRVSRKRRSWLGRLSRSAQDDSWIELGDPHGDQIPAWTALRTAFAELSPEQRAVVSLHLHAGYSVSETAELVGAPLETVRSRLRLAKQRLRRELKEGPR
jgi:RNA polymerase sigma-70 factor (ECF subfamily)